IHVPAAPAPGGWRRRGVSRGQRGYRAAMSPRRRRYPPYDPRYDPRYDPYAYRGGYGPNYGYGYRPGNSCLRDACLIETGCCLAESLDGRCLVATVLLVPQFAR